MALRIYEVANPDREDVSAQSMQQFECDERERDRHLPISNRHDVAKVGDIMGDGRWLSGMRSQHVQVPMCSPSYSFSRTLAIDLAVNRQRWSFA